MIGEDSPVLTVLYGDHRPDGMTNIEDNATVRYAHTGQLAEKLPGSHALFLYDFLSTELRDAWGAADRLQWVHIAAAGVDPVMFDAFRDSDVVLTNSRGVFDTAIAEWVTGAVLAFAKDFAHTLRLQDTATWRHRDTETIHRRRALIVGTGGIGRATARMLTACGMAVTGIGRTARDADADFGTVHASSALNRHLGDADYVVAAAPLTEATKGIFDAAAFAAMKPTARFINVGRGELVDSGDLIGALRAGTIAGAALDVFDTEPLPPDNPLWSMGNVFVSPHMSGDVAGWRSILVDRFAENFARWTAGRALDNVVDKQLGYVPS
ncbi:MAG TPA: D-2-hydroxyacid dehydrogenase [Stackebrandtia sp.]|uniref:D-2-hydroxyacid dehydrogenase n=1 Tax=Stackebrandtia sp. TaxID=2023065 RepID=UPI002D59B0AC|nr:D-2-hydroxyacid dehydrogenase [Stackebrandtia sp.]HZE41660.1 D-2-hydroxyacid dehydrogenase [Stackebrandtia sp.]